MSSGIGNEFARAYLSRPQHTVIGSIRESAASTPNVDQLKTFVAAPGSKLVLVTIDAISPTDAQKAIQEVRSQGIEHLDIVISNIGGSPIPPTPLDTVTADEMIAMFQLNAIEHHMLWQVCRPLLRKSSAPKWVTISSILGPLPSFSHFKYPHLMFLWPQTAYK